MREILGALAAITWACSADGQTTFAKYYYGVGTAQVNLIELTSGNLLAGIAQESGTSLLDAEGNILHSHCYVIDTFLVLQSVKRYSDNEFFFVGAYYKDSCTAVGWGAVGKLYPVIGQMDSLGNVQSLHHYPLNGGCQHAAGDLEITGDKSVIAYGRDADFFAVKADSTGEVVWAKYFSNHGGFRFIKELPGGDLIAGINMTTAGAVIARLDPNGNIIWCRSFFRPKGMIHDCLIESDDAFIITGSTDSIASTNVFDPPPPEYHPSLFMMKLDGSGELQWCKGYDSAPHIWYARRGSHIVRATDGNYVVLANLGAEGFNFHFRPFLMKTDLNRDTLWTRSAGAGEYSHDTSNLLACSDGGFMYSGQGWGLGMYIFKTDSSGYLPCHNKWHEVEISDLFPADSSFTLVPVDGAVALPAFLSDTIYAPVVITDGCTIASTINTVELRKPRIYPNPNTGHCTVEFTDPLLAESYYSVYDALGKLLYQRPLPTGATLQEIDLSRFGRGTYAIKFAGPKGVSYQRVVLE